MHPSLELLCLPSKVWPPLNLRQLPYLLVFPRLSATYTMRDVFAQQCYPDAVQKQCFRKATHYKSKIPGAYPNPFSNPTQLALKSCGRILRNLNRNSGFLLWSRSMPSMMVCVKNFTHQSPPLRCQSNYGFKLAAYRENHSVSVVTVVSRLPPCGFSPTLASFRGFGVGGSSLVPMQIRLWVMHLGTP